MGTAGVEEVDRQDRSRIAIRVVAQDQTLAITRTALAIAGV